MSKFNFVKTDIPEVQIIEPTVFGDDRGYFMETYQIVRRCRRLPPQQQDLRQVGGRDPFR